MNREDIEHMWKVASNDPSHDTNWHDPVVIRFAELVASAERKECENIIWNADDWIGSDAKIWIVKSIQEARGQA